MEVRAIKVEDGTPVELGNRRIELSQGGGIAEVIKANNTSKIEDPFVGCPRDGTATKEFWVPYPCHELKGDCAYKALIGPVHVVLPP